MGGERDARVVLESDYERMDEILVKASSIPEMLLPYYG
jgi:hypothetical protein